MMASRHLAHDVVEENHEGGLMPIFSVGVRRKSSFLTAFSRAQRVYIVEAETERKAKNAVGRYLKSIGKDDACEVWGAVPAEHLPAIAREKGLVAQRKRDGKEQPSAERA